MKTLIIVTHPQLKNSVINKRWIEEISKYPNKYHIHDLYNLYPNENIDIEKEQNIIESHDRIIFQFPFYWFNCPPLLKKWLDEVLTHGWAYGSKSDYKLKNKKIALAISTGIDENEYRHSGQYKYTMQELTAPFQITFEYVKADYKKPFIYYGIEINPSPEWIEKSVPEYLAFIESL